MASPAPANSVNLKGFPLDIHKISLDITEGCLTEIKELFFLEGQYPPILRWCSCSQSDWPIQQQILANYWEKHQYTDQFSLQNFFKLPSADTVIPYLGSVKISENQNFTYAGMGEKVHEYLNISENSPKEVRKILDRNQTTMELLHLTVMIACTIRKQGIQILSQEKNIVWSKLILPLLDFPTKTVKELIFCIQRTPS